MPKKRKRKLGRVSFETGYIVYLDDAEMIERAKEAVLDDVQTAFNNRELNIYLEVEPAPNVDESDISQWLEEEEEE